MDAIDALIALFLTRGGQVFVVPQYGIPCDNPNTEFSCPDFVALDFSHHEIIVVEISVSSDTKKLSNKIRTREIQWYERLRRKFLADNVVDATWDIRFIGFVREANLQKLKDTFKGESEVLGWTAPYGIDCARMRSL